jgi:hypothetical protein
MRLLPPSSFGWNGPGAAVAEFRRARRRRLRPPVEPDEAPTASNRPVFVRKLKRARIRQGLALWPLTHTRLHRASEALVAGAVASTYLAWIMFCRQGGNTGAAALAATTFGSAVIAMISFGLGVHFVSVESRNGTAQALVLTPAPKPEFLARRMSLLLKIVLLSCLLLPVYWCAPDYNHWGTKYDFHNELAVAQGLASRLAAAVGYWGDGRPAASSFFAGLYALGNDFTWYVIFAAGGMLAAVLGRGRPTGWLGGLVLVLAIAALLSCGDAALRGLVTEPVEVPPPPPPPATPCWGWWECYYETSPGPDCLLTFVHVAAMAVVRLAVAWFLLDLAGRNFDRLASD